VADRMVFAGRRESIYTKWSLCYEEDLEKRRDQIPHGGGQV